MAKSRSRDAATERRFAVRWPTDRPEPDAGPPRPVTVPMGRCNGYPLWVLIWLRGRPTDVDARYVAELGGWIAVRID